MEIFFPASRRRKTRKRCKKWCKIDFFRFAGKSVIKGGKKVTLKNWKVQNYAKKQRKKNPAPTCIHASKTDIIWESVIVGGLNIPKWSVTILCHDLSRLSGPVTIFCHDLSRLSGRVTILCHDVRTLSRFLCFLGIFSILKFIKRIFFRWSENIG